MNERNHVQEEVVSFPCEMQQGSFFKMITIKPKYENGSSDAAKL